MWKYSRRDEVAELSDVEKMYFSLEKAKQDSRAYLIMEGDYGGQAYLTCPANQIKCTQEEIDALNNEINETEWNDEEGIDQYYIALRFFVLQRVEASRNQQLLQRWQRCIIT